MGRKGAGKRLSDVQRLEIIQSLDLSNPPSKRQLARQYEVDEKQSARFIYSVAQ